MNAPKSREIAMISCANGSLASGSSAVMMKSSKRSCSVHDYSGDGFRHYIASVDLEFGDSTVSVTCPKNDMGRWWHVVDWNSETGRLLLVNKFTDSDPTYWIQ